MKKLYEVATVESKGGELERLMALRSSIERRITELEQLEQASEDETLERLIALRSNIERRITELEQLEQASEDEEEKARIHDARIYLIIAFENIVLGIKELLG